MGTAVVILILLFILAVAIKSICHRIIHGSACCGERDALPKKIQVKDKNKSHYKYKYILNVDGMHCSNCTRHVENTLNSVEGIWAKANLEKKEVTVLSKNIRENSELEKIVAHAGYTVLSVSIK